MASKKEFFSFLNSTLWLECTQRRYMPLDDIKYRLSQHKIAQRRWPELKKQIQTFRKMGAVPFFFKSIDKQFWYFPSDSINKKIHQAESLGNQLYDRITSTGSFKNGLLSNVAIEEAVTSAIYEGANSTRAKAKDLIASIDAKNRKPKNKDEHMLVNNYLAMKWIKEHSTLPTSNGVVLHIHEIVSKNTLTGDDVNFCGVFRDQDVYVGSHKGVAPKKIEEALSEAINLTEKHPRFIHGLTRGILLHYFIAYIHPFFDGNGRTARTLFYFNTIKNNLNFVELLSISAHLKDCGQKYEKSFDLVVKHDLDMTFFIDFCLDSLLVALKKVEYKINYLMNISCLEQKEKFNLNQILLLQKMALNKYRSISIEEYADDIKKSREVARQDLKGLLKKGYLTELKRGKKFVYLVKSRFLKSQV